MDIVLATRNRKKIEEIRKILTVMGSSVRLFTLDDFPVCEEVEEDGETFEANALKKALYVAGCTGMIAISDDSGLEVDSLGRAPGVRSARYAGEGADDRSNVEKLLREMSDVPDSQRTARFVCCIALASRTMNKTFYGYVQGRIGREQKGCNGFGYDPVFLPDGHERTFAEIEDHEKNAISHRAMALNRLQSFFLENMETFSYE